MHSTSNHIDTAVTAMLKSFYPGDEPPYYVERVALRKLLESNLLGKPTSLSNQGSKRKIILTKVVCGPRGCGKSTIVSEIFDKVPSVVRVLFDGTSQDDLANAIFTSLSVVCPAHSAPANFLECVLEKFKSQGYRLPTLIIEVDKRFGPERLENLLLTCKRLGSDLNLAIPIVILSSSRAAFGMHINAFELRAEYIEVNDLSVEESQIFLHKALENLEGTLDMKEQAIDNVIASVGTRLVHLIKLVPTDTREFNSLDEFNTKVKETEMDLRVLYSGSFRRMVHECPLLQKKIQICCDMIKSGQCEVFQLCEELKIDEKKFLNLNGCIEPHLLYISPKTHTVDYGAHFVEKIMKELRK